MVPSLQVTQIFIKAKIPRSQETSLEMSWSIKLNTYTYLKVNDEEAESCFNILQP
jgi:hypothetical protein